MPLQQNLKHFCIQFDDKKARDETTLDLPIGSEHDPAAFLGVCRHWNNALFPVMSWFGIFQAKWQIQFWEWFSSTEITGRSGNAQVGRFCVQMTLDVKSLFFKALHSSEKARFINSTSILRHSWNCLYNRGEVPLFCTRDFSCVQTKQLKGYPHQIWHVSDFPTTVQIVTFFEEDNLMDFKSSGCNSVCDDICEKGFHFYRCEVTSYVNLHVHKKHRKYSLFFFWKPVAALYHNFILILRFHANCKKSPASRSCSLAKAQQD